MITAENYNDALNRKAIKNSMKFRVVFTSSFLVSSTFKVAEDRLANESAMFWSLSRINVKPNFMSHEEFTNSGSMASTNISRQNLASGTILKVICNIIFYDS